MLKEAESYSLDGVVISYSTPFQFSELLKNFRVDPLKYESPPIVPVDRKVDETYVMSAQDMVNYITQSHRSVSLDTWEYLWNRTADIHGNTGRENQRPWIDMTERTLNDGNVLTCFKNIYFRPKGLQGIESKGAAILELKKKYLKVTHYDVDPWVIIGLSIVFRDVNFVIIQEPGTGILFTDEVKRRFPNVTGMGPLKYSEPEHSPVDQNTLPETIIYQSHFESKIFHYGNIHR
jgi:hypothetical protein